MKTPPRVTTRGLHGLKPAFNNVPASPIGYLEGKNSEMPRILWNSKVHYHIHKPAPVPILSQIDPAMLAHPISLRSTLILSSHLCLGLQCGLLPSEFLTKTLYAPLLPPHVLHVLPICLFDFIIRMIVQSIKFLVM